MPSLFERFGDAARALTGREKRGIPPPAAVFASQFGIPPLFMPGESTKAYGDNVWLYRSVLSIAMEMARIKFRLQSVDDDGEIAVVRDH